MSTCKTKTSFSHLHFHNCIASLLCGFHRCVFFSALDIDLLRVLCKYYVILQTSRLKAKAILKQFRGWKWETNGKRSEENIAVDVDKFFTSSVATWDDAKRLTNWTNQHRHRTRVNPDICLQSALPALMDYLPRTLRSRSGKVQLLINVKFGNCEESGTVIENRYRESPTKVNEFFRFVDPVI